MDRTTLNIILGILMAAGLIWGFAQYWIRKGKYKGKPYTGMRPLFVGSLPHKFPCVLISNYKAVYARHVSNGLTKTLCSFGGGSVTYIDDPRLVMFDNGTDTALITLDTPSSITPTSIREPKRDEKAIIFTKDEAIETSVRDVWPDGKFRVWFNAQPGDSSAAVISEDGKLLGLVTNQGGWCTNLSRIKDRL